MATTLTHKNAETIATIPPLENGSCLTGAEFCRRWDAMPDIHCAERMQDDVYVEAEPEDGLFKSSVFPGLWLDADAMLRGDLKQVLAVLQQGIASPGHADAVRQLSVPSDQDK